MIAPYAKPVIKEATYFLAHVPNLIRYGSKPHREISKDAGVLEKITAHLRSFSDAVAYPPHQVFIGNLSPNHLRNISRPWFNHGRSDATRWGNFGEIMPEAEFLAWLKISDDFDLIWLEEKFAAEIREQLGQHPLIHPADLRKIDQGVSSKRIESELSEMVSLPLHRKGCLVGCVRAGHEEDPCLSPMAILENLSARASGAMALRRLLQISHGVLPGDVEYLLGCGEEAVGDRYNRGGGNLAKAIGELGGCDEATGADVKAFCCAPVHALVLAGSLVSAGLYKNVAVVGGGSLAKLGMKFQGHLAAEMPVLEDMLAAIAILVGSDDGRSPCLRLDVVGRHTIGSGSSQQAIMEKLVREPLKHAGLRITDIGKYSTELHNPEITEPAGSGDVPKTNYRMLAALASLDKDLATADIDRFVETRGMPGFSPTQGHIASAVPYLGHALQAMLRGELESCMFLAKGSLFLGRMTQLSDGLSFLLERNRQKRPDCDGGSLK
jgi:glycine/sarcosine/betaine reductase complex component C subunit beta